MRNPATFNRLQAVIRETGMTTAQIAEAVGASTKAVQRWRSFSPACPDIPEKRLTKLEQIAATQKAA
jgi:hypothetical protein